MCAVSAVGDNWQNQFPNKWPNMLPPAGANPPPIGGGWVPFETNPPTRQEMNALKAEMEELKKLLEAAKAYDEATGQQDCEQAEKIALIKKVAEFVGVDMKDVLG